MIDFFIMKHNILTKSSQIILMRSCYFFIVHYQILSFL